MTLEEYMVAGRETWQFSELDGIHCALGLAGEVGEVVELIKKAEFTPSRLVDKGIHFTDALHEELGDVLYYWVRLCDIMGFDPESIMQRNAAKLAARWGKS